MWSKCATKRVFFFAPQSHHKRLVNAASKKRDSCEIKKRAILSGNGGTLRFAPRLSALISSSFSRSILLKTPTCDHCAADGSQQAVENTAYLIRRLQCPFCFFFVFLQRNLGLAFCLAPHNLILNH